MTATSQTLSTAPETAPVTVACVLLAAGSSRRMQGAHKLLLDAAGQTILRRTAEQLRAAKFSEFVAVTGFSHEQISRELEGWNQTVNAEFAAGMHSSIRRGLMALRERADFIAICLGDQPSLTTEDYNFLISVAPAHRDAAVLVPYFQNERGNPTLIASRLIPEILREPDRDQGCRYLFDRYASSLARVEMPNHRTLIDVDTREAYARYLETAVWA